LTHFTRRAILGRFIFEGAVFTAKISSGRISMAQRTYLAVDLGASSGRHVAGNFNGQMLSLNEIYRFENRPVHAAGHLYWNLLAQWQDVCCGLQAAQAAQLGEVASVGVDTWGVDFGLLGPAGELLGNPVAYRDHRTDGVMEKAFQRVAREEIFACTGLQFMQFNTLYQLWAMRRAGSAQLDVAQSLLMMPDLFHWLLTGIRSNELTNASTTQFYNPRAKRWSTELLEQFDLPAHILGPLSAPGTRLGPLLPDVAEQTGLSGLQVVLPGTHDTASAVAAVPAASPPSQRPNWCYISSGTWSLMGAEVPEPVINEKCETFNFTNEGGIGGTTRLLKNIAGLWLVQECRRIWNAEGRNWHWEDLTRMAAQSRPLISLIDPDDPMFLSPQHMPRAIQTYCKKTGQSVPEGEGAVIRCALESLALRYRQVLLWLEELTGGRIETIHIVGGGTQNRELCQATADACQRLVLAGPVEATAIGNIVVQAISDGQLSSIAEARNMIAASFPPDRYEPRDAAAWDEAFDRFRRLPRH
jgi:rhamnulokinase